MYHTKFGVIRPPELWGDGKSVKKRRPGSGRVFNTDDDGGVKRTKYSEPRDENEIKLGEDGDAEVVEDLGLEEQTMAIFDM